MTFTIELAGVTAEISCRHEKSREFFHSYLSEETPMLRITPTDEDLALSEQKLKNAAQQEKKEGVSLHSWHVETDAIHALLANALTDYDVLLVHGSAIIMDGETYIFLANSGTGKSTHTRLWRETFGDRTMMLNDDKPMLKRTDSGILVYGTPWDGKHHLSSNASAPLKALVKLTRSDNNEIKAMSKAEALATLVEHAIRPNSAEKMAKVLQLETDIVNRSAAYWLRCNTEPEAAQIAWQGMNAENRQNA